MSNNKSNQETISFREREREREREIIEVSCGIYEHPYWKHIQQGYGY